MNVIRVAVTLGLAWLAVDLILRNQRAAAAQEPGDDALAPFPSVDPGLPLGRAAATAGNAPASAAAATGGNAPASAAAAGGTGSESPNDAERLEARGVATTSDDAKSADLFDSTSQESPYARAPGLPDFARGA